jgi:hypothetical protein
MLVESNFEEECEKKLKSIGINKEWFSRTTRNIRMISSLYFTATRNVMASDIVHVFENILNIGKVYENCINIVQVTNKMYNHIFLKIEWNDSIETANFVNELVAKSCIKIQHNWGFWLCRMNHHPLKMRSSKNYVNVASFYCDESDDDDNNNEISNNNESENVSIQIADIKENCDNEDEDFYVIKEENI